jgi:lipopolysaccharide export system protein LptA
MILAIQIPPRRNCKCTVESTEVLLPFPAFDRRENSSHPAPSMGWSLTPAALAFAADAKPTKSQTHGFLGQKVSAGNQTEDKRVYISADKLVTDNNKKVAEFIGNVTASRGDTVITANRLDIHFEASEKKNELVAGEEAIQKIIAKGKVRIRFGHVLAETQQAVYTKKNRTVVLTGANSWVGDGKNSIAGATITLYMDDNSIRATRGKQDRVEAVFQAGTN